MILVLFYGWEDTRIWGHWNSSLNMIALALVGAIYPKHRGLPFPHPEFPSGALEAGRCSGWWLDPCRNGMAATFCLYNFKNNEMNNALNLKKKKKNRTISNLESDAEALVVQLCPTLCDPMNCSLPGFSVHGLPQARILEWIVMSFSRVHLLFQGIFPKQDWS